VCGCVSCGRAQRDRTNYQFFVYHKLRLQVVRVFLFYQSICFLSAGDVFVVLEDENEANRVLEEKLADHLSATLFLTIKGEIISHIAQFEKNVSVGTRHRITSRNFVCSACLRACVYV
jgi:hypothetical protein